MKQEFKDWFLNTDKPIQGEYTLEDRKYSFINFYKDEVPFHSELRDHIFNLHPFQNTYYDLYHLHFWNEGDFFSEHIDDNFGRKWAYVCELKQSDCNTSLVANGESIKEGVFDSKTPHYLPEIKKGTRVSLTVFGLPFKSLV